MNKRMFNHSLKRYLCILSVITLIFLNLLSGCLGQKDSEIRTLRVGTKVFNRLSFQVDEAEIVSIVGPSGCGKSTLLNIIAGFDLDYQGSLIFEGEAVRNPSSERVMIFQNPQLFFWLSAGENISFGLKRKGLSKDNIDSLTESYLS